MKIMFLTFYEAYPPVSGAASVSWNMAKQTNGDKTLVQVGRQPGAIRHHESVTILTLPGFVEYRLLRMLRLTGWIFQMIRHIKQINPDVIVLEGASWVVYHWLLIKMIRLLVDQIYLIYHAHNVEYHLRKEKHSRLIIELTRRAEGSILKEVDVATAVSSNDCRQFQILYGFRPELLPNGVDTDQFDKVVPTQIEIIKKQYALDCPTILFMGAYQYRPNREGIDFLIHNVMPKVIMRHPNAKLVIIGGNVPFKKPWLISPGYISFQKLPTFIKACKIGVAPIFSGSGTRLKILEYMAAGKPVVTTAKGIEGIHAREDTDFLSAEEDVDFVKAIDRLLVDVTLSELIGQNGRKTVDRIYGWKKILKGFPNQFLPAKKTADSQPFHNPPPYE